jgi:hypothetical protein
MLGSVYHNDVTNCIFKNRDTSVFYSKYDEVWISPHFKYCQEYYKIRYNTEKVFLCPYMWSSVFLEKYNTIDNVLTDV